jgi:hypothetical protein
MQIDDRLIAQTHQTRGGASATGFLQFKKKIKTPGLLRAFSM